MLPARAEMGKDPHPVQGLVLERISFEILVVVSSILLDVVAKGSS